MGWFSRKKKTESQPETPPEVPAAQGLEQAPVEPEEQAAPAAVDPRPIIGAPVDGIAGAPVQGNELSYGPFDGDTVAIEEFDFSDFAAGILDLGSLKVAMPKEAQLQIEMDETGPKMLHIVTHYGRITPVAFAAATKGGEWASNLVVLQEQLTNDGLTCTLEQGPWGRELVGRRDDLFVRIIGADGPRWMVRFTLACPTHSAAQMTQLGRDVFARTFVYRGEQPALAGTALPITLPEDIAQGLQQEIANRQAAQEQAAAAAAARPAEPAAPTPEPPAGAGATEGPAGSALQQMKETQN